MKGDDIKQEFEILIRKEVASLKEGLLETFKSKQKSYKGKLILSRKKSLN